MADIHVAPGEPALATPGFGTLLDSWRQIIATGNLPKGRAIDGLSRWLLITRACVFSMTLTSGLIGGLLAAATAGASRWGYFALALLGLVIAHAANNMINDYFDLSGGVDTAEYTRALYAPHPILSGLITKRGLLAAIAAVNLADLAILAALVAARGGAPARPPGAESVLAAAAGEAASGLPRLAALVRVAGLLSQQAGGRPLRARAGAERGVWAIGAGTRAFGGRGGGCMRTSGSGSGT